MGYSGTNLFPVTTRDYLCVQSILIGQCVTFFKRPVRLIHSSTLLALRMGVNAPKIIPWLIMSPSLGPCIV